MDFKQLEAYVKVIETASFTKAADVIFMSQPSVSAYIRSLEKELGATLVNRSSKEVSPTPAGKILYENAKELLALKSRTVEGIRNLSGSFSGDISIAASSVPAQYILPEILSGFTKMYPGISVTVRQSDTYEVSRVVALQQAEIGFSGDTVENSRCDFVEFMTDKMVVIGPPGMGFCDTKEYFLEALMYEYPFISRELGSGTRGQYEAFFAKHDIDISRASFGICFDNTHSIINAVACGAGISMVSEIAARAFVDSGMVVPLRLITALPARKLYYVLKKGIVHSHLVDLLVRHISH